MNIVTLLQSYVFNYGCGRCGTVTRIATKPTIVLHYLVNKIVYSKTAGTLSAVFKLLL